MGTRSAFLILNLDKKNGIKQLTIAANQTVLVRNVKKIGVGLWLVGVRLVILT